MGGASRSLPAAACRCVMGPRCLRGHRARRRPPRADQSAQQLDGGTTTRRPSVPRAGLRPDSPLAVGWDGIAKTPSKHIDGRKMCCVVVCSWHPWHHFLARRVLHKVWLVFDDRRYTPCACMGMVLYNDSSYWFVARKCR